MIHQSTRSRFSWCYLFPIVAKKNLSKKTSHTCCCTRTADFCCSFSCWPILFSFCIQACAQRTNCLNWGFLALADVNVAAMYMYTRCCQRACDKKQLHRLYHRFLVEIADTFMSGMAKFTTLAQFTSSPKLCLSFLKQTLAEGRLALGRNLIDNITSS